MGRGKETKIQAENILKISSMKDTNSYRCCHLQISRMFSNDLKGTGQERTDCWAGPTPRAGRACVTWCHACDVSFRQRGLAYSISPYCSSYGLSVPRFLWARTSTWSRASSGRCMSTLWCLPGHASSPVVKEWAERGAGPVPWGLELAGQSFLT